MQTLAQLAEQICGRHGAVTTLRPGAVFAYFGGGAGLAIRMNEREGVYDCTLLCPAVPVQTRAVSASAVLDLVRDVAAGRFGRAPLGQVDRDKQGLLAPQQASTQPGRAA